MAATQNKMIVEAEQMKRVLQELNTHPEARLFYALQERGATCGTFSTAEYGNSAGTKLTLRVITDKVNKHLYPNLSAFVDDMTMIFSSCSNTPLASGAAGLRELFTELLSKFTSSMDADTPPGKKKRFRNATALPSFMEEDDDAFFVEIDSDDDFGDICIADESFGDEILHSEDRAALLELTEEIASIEAEIQQLKETKQDLHKDSAQPGFTSHPSVLDALKTPSYSSFGGLYSSGQEEGRVLLNGQSKKRSRRNSIAKGKPEDGSPVDKRRRKSVAQRKNSKQKQDFEAEIMTKEQLLYTITHDLPPKFLEGVIRIVNPTFDPATATDEDLEFDINLLDEEVLAELQDYVNKILQTPIKKRARPQKAKVTHRKETPKKRLQKEAPKKVNRKRAGGSRKRSSMSQGYGTAAQKKQQTLLAATLAKRNAFVSAEIMQQIFMKEEIVRVNKSVASEDEEVDILD